MALGGTGRGVRRFRFAPGAPPRRELAFDRFIDGLTGSLAEAGGLGVSFRIRWTTGRDAAPEIEVDSPESVRWLLGSLSRAYPAGRWTADGVEGRRPSAALCRFGVADPTLGTPAVGDHGATPWSEPARRGLRTLPHGLTVVWSLRPGADRSAPRPAAPSIEPTVLPPGVRFAGLTAGERRLRDAIDARRRDARWSVDLRMEIEDESARPLVLRASRLISRTSALPAGGRISWRRPLPWQWSAPPTFALSLGELVALFPTPWDTGGVDDSARRAAGSFVLGRNDLGAVVRLTIPSGEGRHLAVLGQTGMGKSSVLVRLALLAAREGTVVVFDPIGDTARSLLDRLPHAERERALWVSAAPGNVTFNAIAPTIAPDRSPAHRAKALADLVDALRRVRLFRFGTTPFWGPRLEEMLGRAIAAAGAYPHGTLLDAEHLLAGVGRRTATGVPEAARPLVEELESLARSRPEEVDGARRLLAEVTRNEVLHGVLCARTPTADPRALVAPGRISVISGEAPVVGEAPARYFLGILLALIWAELLARPGGGKTFLVLDEAQWYAHEAAAEVLRLGRRSNVHLWLATQSLAGLGETVREAVLTNAADFLVFRGSPDDAREFARWSGQVGVEEFLSLGRGEALAFVGGSAAPDRVRIPALPPVDPIAAARRPVAARRPPPLAELPAAPDAPVGGGVPPLELLAAAAELAPPGPRFDFPFGPVRAACDPSGTATRELGATLRRAGVLVRRGSGPTGGVWVIDRARFARWRAAAGEIPVSDEARALWNRWRGADAGAG